MGKFVRGDIVVLPFPFSDLSASKKRPALVLADLEGNDHILCQITSKNVRDGKAVTIAANHVENGSLHGASNARPNKLFTADENIILYKAGSLCRPKLDTVIDTVVRIFKNQ